jgi:hypothetical protein
MKMRMIMCFQSGYCFEGYTFEYHDYMGPQPIRKDGEPRKTIPKGFWEAFDRWNKLPDEEQEKYRIYGGCQVGY